MATAKKPKYKVGQIVVLRHSDGKLPTRVLAAARHYGVWYYQLDFHTGHYLESILRPLTGREAGRV